MASAASYPCPPAASRSKGKARATYNDAEVTEILSTFCTETDVTIIANAYLENSFSPPEDIEAAQLLTRLSKDAWTVATNIDSEKTTSSYLDALYLQPQQQQQQSQQNPIHDPTDTDLDTLCTQQPQQSQQQQQHPIFDPLDPSTDSTIVTLIKEGKYATGLPQTPLSDPNSTPLKEMTFRSWTLEEVWKRKGEFPRYETVWMEPRAGGGGEGNGNGDSDGNGGEGGSGRKRKRERKRKKGEGKGKGKEKEKVEEKVENGDDMDRKGDRDGTVEEREVDASVANGEALEAVTIPSVESDTEEEAAAAEEAVENGVLAVEEQEPATGFQAGKNGPIRKPPPGLAGTGMSGPVVATVQQKKAATRKRKEIEGKGKEKEKEKTPTPELPTVTRTGRTVKKAKRAGDE
ncbi:MAG: hypothetical protein L6R41_007335 [Letrouitia leprolyta]|nr:MAG: hypothetical protein L6R41_007335 [Letrouitia leprolyta]